MKVMDEEESLDVLPTNEKPIDLDIPPEKAVTILIDKDGNIKIELFGLSHLELPTLFRLAAKNIEKQLGAD